MFVDVIVIECDTLSLLLFGIDLCCDDCCARVAHCYFSSVLPALLLLLLFVNHLFCGAGGGAQMAAFQLELDPAGHLDTRTRIDREVPPLFHIPPSSSSSSCSAASTGTLQEVAL